MTSVPFTVNDREVRQRFLQVVLPETIAALKGNATPGWGRMTAQHMVEHLTWGFRLSTGRSTAPCRMPESQLERFKPWLYDDRPSPRDFKNPELPDAPVPLRCQTLADAKEAFQAELDHFLAMRQAGSETQATHPVFGPLGLDEWERVHFKHCYHHLLQFDLLAVD